MHSDEITTNDLKIALLPVEGVTPGLSRRLEWHDADNDETVSGIRHTVQRLAPADGEYIALLRTRGGLYFQFNVKVTRPVPQVEVV